jgi:hypothetical protein
MVRPRASQRATSRPHSSAIAPSTPAIRPSNRKGRTFRSHSLSRRCRAPGPKRSMPWRSSANVTTLKKHFVLIDLGEPLDNTRVGSRSGPLGDDVRVEQPLPFTTGIAGTYARLAPEPRPRRVNEPTQLLLEVNQPRLCVLRGTYPRCCNAAYALDARLLVEHRRRSGVPNRK